MSYPYLATTLAVTPASNSVDPRQIKLSGAPRSYPLLEALPPNLHYVPSRGLGCEFSAPSEMLRAHALRKRSEKRILAMRLVKLELEISARVCGF
jgi:hypothetical protein